MKRRSFAAALSAAGAAWGVSSALPAWAQQRAVPQARVNYRPLPSPAPVESAPGKIEVVEFFWYGCPHCNSFEPQLHNWLKQVPKDVAFRRVPANFNPLFAVHQQMYYALEAMGVLNSLHTKIFAALHVQRLKLDTPEVIGDWLATQGVKKADFIAQYRSFSVASRSKKATQLQNAYQIEGVPSFGVAGRFYVGNELNQGDMGRVLNVVDFLIGEVRKGR
jgi:protein dithiol oxidoreductase (disulfide-forming)